MRRSLLRVLVGLRYLLYRRTSLVLALLLCAGIAAALWNMSRLSINLVESQAIQNATLYAQAIEEARTLYSSDAVDRLQVIHSQGIVVTDNFNLQQAVPVPATFMIELGQRISKKNPGMSVRLFSDYPFPVRQKEGGPRDAFEREALRQLRQNPEQPFIRFETWKGRPCLRYAQADIMKPSCVSCHNTHPDSPKKDWKVGDVRGILEVTSPLDSFITQTQTGLRGSFVMLAGISILGILGIALVIGKLRQTSKDLEQRVIDRTAQLQDTNVELTKAQEKSERLLLNILPPSIAEKLKERTSHIADGFAEATILFADIVGFTEISQQLSPTQLVSLLNEIFTAFDGLTERHKLEKIKTIGDAYMVAGGIPKFRSDHAEAIAEMALDMRKEIAKFNLKYSVALNVRIGINTGPVVAGVIGTKKFIYDLWGDAVNTASRMESHGLAGCIQVTQSTYERLQDNYLFQERGRIPIKGKGEMITYLLIGKKLADVLV